MADYDRIISFTSQYKFQLPAGQAWDGQVDLEEVRILVQSSTGSEAFTPIGTLGELTALRPHDPALIHLREQAKSINQTEIDRRHVVQKVKPGTADMMANRARNSQPLDEHHLAEQKRNNQRRANQPLSSDEPPTNEQMAAQRLANQRQEEQELDNDKTLTDEQRSVRRLAIQERADQAERDDQQRADQHRAARRRANQPLDNDEPPTNEQMAAQRRANQKAANDNSPPTKTPNPRAVKMNEEEEQRKLKKAT